MYANREVFPNAPLALVVAEVRFTDSPRLRQQESLDAIAIALENRFPIVNQVSGIKVIEPANPGLSPQVEPQQAVVLLNATGTESITITPSSVAYETTAYSEFDDLCSGMNATCDALLEANVRPAVMRVGLRYIDEVRVPELVTDVRDWGKWIDGSLIGPLAIGPEQRVAVQNVQGLVAFDLGDGKGLNFQYRALTHGAVVEPMYLKRKKFKQGPLFVLDFDGFQDFSNNDSLVPLKGEIVVDTLSAVHAPAGAAFQRAITDDARILFRGDSAWQQ